MKKWVWLGMWLWVGLTTPPCAAQDGQKLTRLRVGTPTGIFENWGKGVRLSSATVEVRNVGDVPAEGVDVTLTLPDGQGVPMRGPDTLARNQSATYSMSGWEYVFSDKKLRASAGCSNCRR